MVEKKFVIDGMELAYDGSFDILEFFKTVDRWINDKGKEKEVKKKLENVESSGKKLEQILEIWEDVTDFARSVVRMRALFTDVKETKVKAKKRVKKLNKGKVLIIIDGILETDLEGRWQQRPLFYFMRALADKFIYKFYMNKIEDKLAADCYDLHNTLTDFFDPYKV